MKIISKIKSLTTDYLFSLSNELIGRGKMFYVWYRVIQETTWIVTKVYVRSVLRYYERISKR